MCFPSNVIKMAVLSSTSTSRANKYHREDKSTSQVNYTFQGNHLKRLIKHLLINMVEYFKKEAKKNSKGHRNILERVSKATGKIYIVVYIKENSNKLRINDKIRS